MSKKKLLVIDDEEVVREAVQDILESVEIPVLLATNGREGLELFKTHHPDIKAVLLDMRMPGLSGPDTLRELRLIDPEIAVILSSGYSEDETKYAIHGSTNITFLPKPYHFDKLIHVVEQVLNGVE